MKYYCLMLNYVIVFAPAHQKKVKDVTLSVHDRVNLLKRQIAEQIEAKQQRASELLLPINSDHDDYTYVDVEKNPITPIMDFDERKKKDKFKLREIITPPDTETSNVVPRAITKRRKRKHRIAKPMAKPLDSFYRRVLSDENEPVQWIHCQDLITPFFSGFKNDITVTKRLTMNDHHSVLRLLQLLSLNTTGHSKEEIYSILYQISNIQIRLFQWDVSAITALLNVVIKDNAPHTLKRLARGVRLLLDSWHLDFGNTTNLLKQARIFRPPCVKVSEYEGSTKTSRGKRFKASTSPGLKSTCALPDARECRDRL